MTNTALFEEHRNKGVYSAFLKILLPFLKEKGYQIVSSKHQASNNPVLIAKLKAGFYIQSMEIDLPFGTLVKLYYFFNEKAKAYYFYRTGSRKLDE